MPPPLALLPGRRQELRMTEDSRHFLLSVRTISAAPRWNTGEVARGSRPACGELSPQLPRHPSHAIARGPLQTFGQTSRSRACTWPRDSLSAHADASPGPLCVFETGAALPGSAYGAFPTDNVRLLRIYCVSVWRAGRLTESKGFSSDGLVGDVASCTRDLGMPDSDIVSIGGSLVGPPSWHEPAVPGRGGLRVGEPTALLADL
jgi:hypothetical protein